MDWHWVVASFCIPCIDCALMRACPVPMPKNSAKAVKIEAANLEIRMCFIIYRHYTKSAHANLYR